MDFFFARLAQHIHTRVEVGLTSNRVAADTKVRRNAVVGNRHRARQGIHHLAHTAVAREFFRHFAAQQRVVLHVVFERIAPVGRVLLNDLDNFFGQTRGFEL